MASLLGKADPTLVQGAFREAMADVPADMSKVYAKREKTLEDFTTEVNKIWEKQFEDYKAFETRIIDKSDIAITNALQGKTNTKLLKNVESEVFRIKEKMKTFDKRGKDKGNVEWRKLEEELNKLVMTTGANAEAFNSLNEAIVNNELHITGAPPKILELYEAMVDDYNNDTSFTNAKYVDGDQVYTHPDDPNVTMTFGELQKKLEGKNPKPAVDTQEVLNGVKKYAASSKRPLTDRYIKDINNQLLKIMRTPNDRANVMYERFEGLDYSFFEALTGKDPVLQEQIYDALDAMGGINIDGIPGKENRETYSTPENAYLLQQAIMKDKTIVADFLTDNIVADNYKIGEGNRQNTPGTGNPYGTSSIEIPGMRGSFISPQTASTRRTLLENGQEITGAYGKYVPQDDGSWILNDVKPMSTYEVFSQEGLLQAGDTMEKFGGTNIDQSIISEEDAILPEDKKQGIETIDDEITKKVRLPYDIAKSNVKKIDGKWYVQEGSYGNKKWVEVSKSQLKKINKQYK